jgi:hypothetical protein
MLLLVPRTSAAWLGLRTTYQPSASGYLQAAQVKELNT